MTREVGMLDVGTHCSFCRQNDFLPFHCTDCNGDFCSSHRLREDHHCESLKYGKHSSSSIAAATSANTSASASTKKSSGGSFLQALLPARAPDRIQALLKEDQSKPVDNLKSKLLGGKSKSSAHAVDKLRQFFTKNGKLFDSKKSTTRLSSANRLIQVTKMKRTARGDDAIPVANRIYVWCYVVADSPQSDKKPTANEVFINKMWPVGRALDSLASVLNVKNSNIDHSISTDEKLFLYKGDASSQQLLASSARVSSTINEGDTLYLVRGLEINS
ncbi:unnamed protein product [Kluyveromyces dobzhanskii CBS 2104]|uniref:WGS project CCBQ000000000 data, contig 00102 n=1 Tax=Kluyveromyces dobzhanskii CBS 2104 TaxID=1427455 RepID=A0A0A8L416_9SACH|nr:unnamed protein product [Kluyveromyces dobzhanskii CBS 2104]